MPGLLRAIRIDIYRLTVMIDNSKNSIPEIHQSQFKDRGSPVQQIGEDTNHHSSDVNSTNTRHLSEKFQTLHQSSIASPLNPPIGIKSPAARAASPAPRASHAPAQHALPAARSLPPGLLPDSAIPQWVLRCLPYAVPLTSSDTAPAPARLGSVRPTNPQPAQAAYFPPRRAAPAPSSQKRPMVTKS